MSKHVVDEQSQNWAVFAHLSGFLGYVVPFGNILGPLLIWIFKRSESLYIEEQSREAVNFQISVSIYILIAGALSFILIGIPFLIGLLILQIFCMIKGAIVSGEGKDYKYPFSIKFIK